jgi:hypothetical protein
MEVALNDSSQQLDCNLITGSFAEHQMPAKNMLVSETGKGGSVG